MSGSRRLITRPRITSFMNWNSLFLRRKERRTSLGERNHRICVSISVILIELRCIGARQMLNADVA